MGENKQNEAFWQQPPWFEGRSKHRLGLRPIDIAALWQPDGSLFANKSLQLETNYTNVVGTMAGYERVACDIPGLELSKQRYPDWIANVGTMVAEDLCLIDTTDENRFVAGCLAAPSYWLLHEKLGQALFEVHAPVEGMNAKIGTRVDGFFSRLPIGRPFRRANWFVHAEAEYFRTDSSTRSLLDADPADWFFRSESQTLLRLDEQFVLFVIAVTFVPVSDLARNKASIEPLLASLSAMDRDEISHFGGVAKFQRLTDYVASLVRINS
ncbi:MAG: DUF3445 domain-containing protein [Pseudomonadales bacterium]|nr:DUF3445 domain-containing protein [Pseudomonadales bacterium]